MGNESDAMKVLAVLAASVLVVSFAGLLVGVAVSSEVE